MIQINITNKAVYSLGILLVLAVTVGVYAYNSGNTPDILGHSGEEIELILPDESVVTLDQFAANVLASQGQWPTGSYCIIQAQNQQCPAGFIATSPRFYQAVGGEFVVGAVNPNPQSINGNFMVDLGDLQFGNLQGQVWAWCCK